VIDWEHSVINGQQSVSELEQSVTNCFQSAIDWKQSMINWQQSVSDREQLVIDCFQSANDWQQSIINWKQSVTDWKQWMTDCSLSQSVSPAKTSVGIVIMIFERIFSRNCRF
jgi:hypothetical protein